MAYSSTDLALIIGCTVGGGVLVILILVLIFICTFRLHPKSADHDAVSAKSISAVNAKFDPYLRPDNPTLRRSSSDPAKPGGVLPHRQTAQPPQYLVSSSPSMTNRRLHDSPCSSLVFPAMTRLGGAGVGRPSTCTTQGLPPGPLGGFQCGAGSLQTHSDDGVGALRPGGIHGLVRTGDDEGQRRAGWATGAGVHSSQPNITRPPSENYVARAAVSRGGGGYGMRSTDDSRLMTDDYYGSQNALVSHATPVYADDDIPKPKPLAVWNYTGVGAVKALETAADDASRRPRAENVYVVQSNQNARSHQTGAIITVEQRGDRRTIYPPQTRADSTVQVVRAIVEPEPRGQPDAKTIDGYRGVSRTGVISMGNDDKQVVGEAFKFLDEFEE